MTEIAGAAAGGLPARGAPGVGGDAPLGARRSEQPGDAAAFNRTLEALQGSPLRFSGHAMKRIEQRGLQINTERLDRLEQAVERARSKGARDSVVLLDELALVVSVQNQTVVTALDEASRKEHVFTNVDSVVIAD